MLKKLSLLATMALSGLVCVSQAKMTDTCYATGLNLHADTGVSLYNRTDINKKNDLASSWMFSFGAGYKQNFGDPQSWLYLADLDFNYLGTWKDNKNKQRLLYGFSLLGGIGPQFNKRTSSSLLVGLSLVRAPTVMVRPTVGVEVEYSFAANLSIDANYKHTFKIMNGIDVISIGSSYYW